MNLAQQRSLDGTSDISIENLADFRRSHIPGAWMPQGLPTEHIVEKMNFT
jgi:hypothetical protein